MIIMKRTAAIEPTQVFVFLPPQEAVGFFRWTPSGDIFGKTTTKTKRCLAANTNNAQYQIELSESHLSQCQHATVDYCFEPT